MEEPRRSLYTREFVHAFDADVVLADVAWHLGEFGRARVWKRAERRGGVVVGRVRRIGARERARAVAARARAADGLDRLACPRRVVLAAQAAAGVVAVEGCLGAEGEEQQQRAHRCCLALWGQP